jgi:hypothetical protein
VYIMTRLSRQMEQEGISKIFAAAEAATAAIKDAQPLLQQATSLVEEITPLLQVGVAARSWAAGAAGRAGPLGLLTPGSGLRCWLCQRCACWAARSAREAGSGGTSEGGQRCGAAAGCRRSARWGCHLAGRPRMRL